MLVNYIAYLEELAKRPSLMSPLGRRRELAATRDLQAYFRVTGIKIVQLELERLYESFQPPTTDPSERVLAALSDQAMHAAANRVDTVLRSTRPLLVQVLLVNLEAAYREGFALSVFSESGAAGTTAATYSEARGDKPATVKPTVRELDKLGTSGSAAADYATAHAAQLVKGLDNTTRTAVAEAVGQGITQMLGVGGAGRLIRGVAQSMSRYRAELIASTEMNDAMSQAALDKMKKIGIARKRIVLAPNACPVCRANAAQGSIPVSQEFKSGNSRTPFHPGCRCAVVAARGED